jgi:hypothetical protein
MKIKIKIKIEEIEGAEKTEERVKSENRRQRGKLVGQFFHFRIHSF